MNWTIGKKLTVSFGAMFAVALILGWGSLSVIGKMKSSFDRAMDINVRKIDIADRIGAARGGMLAAERGLLMFLGAKDAAQADAQRRAFSSNAAEVVKALAEIRPMLETAEGIEIHDRIQKNVQVLTAGFREIDGLASAEDAAGAIRVEAEKTMPAYNTVETDSARLATLARNLLEKARGDAGAQHSLSRTGALVLSLLAMALGGGVFFLVRNINRRLRNLAGQMAGGAAQIATAASQVAAGSQQLAQGASEQAASLEETSASTEQISATTKKNADNSQSAAQLVEASALRIDEANQKLEQMLASMNGITDSSQKISKIIKVIDEIAFQTNILALNAAVEAARAGEAGMGFAVVADEVRNLAQRSAQAARDTAAMIEESIAKTREGGGKLDQVASAIKAITESSLQVKTLVQEVNTGSREQARGIEQVAKAVAEMEHVTQRSAASAQESASASAEMSAQSESMKHVAAELQAMVGGEEDERRPAAKAPGKVAGKSAARPVAKPAAGKTPAKPDAKAAPKAAKPALKPAAKPLPDTRKSLQALDKAVRKELPFPVASRLPQPAKAQPAKAKAQPVKAGAVKVPAVKTLDKSSFPLDDDFKEF